MEEIFYRQICSVCKHECNNHKRNINHIKNNDITIYSCPFYEKDVKKIIPYKKPLFVTANRDYVTDLENY